MCKLFRGVKSRRKAKGVKQDLDCQRCHGLLTIAQSMQKLTAGPLPVAHFPPSPSM